MPQLWEILNDSPADRRGLSVYEIVRQRAVTRFHSHRNPTNQSESHLNYSKQKGGGFDSLKFNARISCYGCFLPDLTGFTTYRHCRSEPSPPNRSFESLNVYEYYKPKVPPVN